MKKIFIILIFSLLPFISIACSSNDRYRYYEDDYYYSVIYEYDYLGRLVYYRDGYGNETYYFYTKVEDL